MQIEMTNNPRAAGCAYRRVKACDPARRVEPRREPLPCAPGPRVERVPDDSGPIPFFRYLEKHNREDRVDASRTAAASSDSATRQRAERRGPRSVTADRLARAYAGNPIPRLGEVLNTRG